MIASNEPFFEQALRSELVTPLMGALVRDSYVSGVAISIAAGLLFHPTASAESIASRMGIGLETVRASLRLLIERGYLQRAMIHRGQQTRLVINDEIVIAAERRW